jgi:hypothetical protein
MGLNLTTRADYKAYVGIKSTTQDTVIDALIPRVSDFVKNYCKRTFVDHWENAKTELFDGGFDKLILAENPVRAISSVQYSADFGQTYTTLTQYTDYVIDGYSVRSILPSGFPYVLRGYKVTYTAGYEDTPQDLELAVFDLMTYYLKSDSAVHSQKVPSPNTTQIQYISDSQLPAHIKRVLDNYQADYT